MKIIIIRHGKVIYNWNKWYTSEEYDQACKEYDEAMIVAERYKVPDIEYQNVIISGLSRTRDTAENLHVNGELKKTSLINEVPLKSSVDTKLKLPLWYWNISGRLQWFFNSPRQEEKRIETRKRARRFAKILIKENKDCLVVTHGFYMHTLLGEMKKMGFIIGKTHSSYKNGEYVVAEK